jgi:phytoene synthase
MADVVSQSTQPALGAIKLAWWRERLEELDQGKVPAEPRLRAAAAELLPRGITGVALAQIEPGWATLLQETPDPEVALNRGVNLFGLAARLLGSDPPQSIQIAGSVYAAGSLSRRRLAPEGLPAVTDSLSVPSRFRPLTGLAALARRDLARSEPEATPGRALVLLRHRLTGRL